MRKPSQYELELRRQMAMLGIEPWEEEYPFAKHLKGPTGRPRMFRFDYAWPARKIAAEVDGGRFMVRRGRGGQAVPVGQHMSEADYEKLNIAAAEGWRVLRFSPAMIRTGKALKVLEEVLMR